MEIKIIPLHPFPKNLHVIFSKPDEAFDYIKQHSQGLDHLTVEDLHYSFGYTVRDGNCTIFLYIHKPLKKDIGLLVHESLHAVQFLMEFMDTPFTNDTSEVYAYMQQYIINKILK